MCNMKLFYLIFDSAPILWDGRKKTNSLIENP
jgi:hypothetical protein